MVGLKREIQNQVELFLAKFRSDYGRIKTDPQKFFDTP